MSAVEVNFDGLPGPTHSYAGLAEGNLASERNRNLVANPRQAALQGLSKMKALADAGYAQAVLPPQERPAVDALRALGFAGAADGELSDASVVARAAREAPQLLAACSSAAAMWVANAATVSPSSDTADGRVHFTPANLVSNFHRALEAPTTTRILRSIFADAGKFMVHEPLPAAAQFGDEGAANHMRFAAGAADSGVEVFVYGRAALDASTAAPKRFPARQTREASEAIARRHGLDPGRTLFVQQDPAAIDAGAFHNDVVAVGNGAVLFCHEQAFVAPDQLFASLHSGVGAAFTPIVAPESEVSLDRAVATYLFNSQLISRAEGGMLLVAPSECLEDDMVAAYLQRLAAGAGPIREVRAFDLRQSMKNGGGPACLRLRVAMSDAERAAIAANIWLDDALHAALSAWVIRHYRDRLAPADLADPALLDEGRRALDELSALLRIGSVYPFQRV
jgi:succinylarginine dihydrolase